MRQTSMELFPVGCFDNYLHKKFYGPDHFASEAKLYAEDHFVSEARLYADGFPFVRACNKLCSYQWLERLYWSLLQE